MSKIFVESKPVAFGFDHLYVVYEDAGAEFVVRGGPDFDLPPFGQIVTEWGVAMAGNPPGTNPSEDNRPKSDAAAHHSRELDLGGRDAAAVWNLMVQQSVQIQNADIDYDINILSESQNSNSVFSSVLNAVGINPFSHLPFTITNGDVPGNENFLDFDTLLNGTASPDIIVGGDGSDELHGNNGNDKIYGDEIFTVNDTNDSHNDRLFGKAGDDFIFGDIGNDYLEGGIDFDQY